MNVKLADDRAKVNKKISTAAKACREKQQMTIDSNHAKKATSDLAFQNFVQRQAQKRENLAAKESRVQEQLRNSHLTFRQRADAKSERQRLKLNDTQRYAVFLSTMSQFSKQRVMEKHRRQEWQVSEQNSSRERTKQYYRMTNEARIQRKMDRPVALGGSPLRSCLVTPTHAQGLRIREMLV